MSSPVALPLISLEILLSRLFCKATKSTLVARSQVRVTVFFVIGMTLIVPLRLILTSRESPSPNEILSGLNAKVDDCSDSIPLLSLYSEENASCKFN